MVPHSLAIGSSYVTTLSLLVSQMDLSSNYPHLQTVNSSPVRFTFAPVAVFDV